MLRRACNWLLLVLPPGWVVAFAFSTWLVIEGLAAFLHWQFPVPGVADPLLRARDARWRSPAAISMSRPCGGNSGAVALRLPICCRRPHA